MFEVKGTKLSFNKKSIYEAPSNIIDYVYYKNDFIVMYDPNGIIDKFGWSEGLPIRNCNVRRITPTGAEVWKIRGGGTSGYHGLWFKDGKEYWAYNRDDKCYQFDPETGEVLGWTYTNS